MPPTPHRWLCLGPSTNVTGKKPQMGVYSCHTGSHFIDDPPDMGPYIQQDNIQLHLTICKCTKNIKQVIGELTMIGKLPKSEAWKESDPDRPGLLLHQRYSSRDSLSESIACALKQTRAEKFYRTPKDSDRASTFELRGGLPIGREVLRPSDPHHSPDNAMPSYYTKDESFASGISKV
jgi:hypothetical protein